MGQIGGWATRRLAPATPPETFFTLCSARLDDKLPMLRLRHRAAAPDERQTMKSTVLNIAATVALGILAVAPAKADIQFDERGSVGYLTSFHLRPGDDQAFAEFLDRPRSQPLRIIYMNSRGGNPEVGMAIGRMIRERGLDTGFHAGHGRCVSACTAMFLGGVHRYYLGGEHVRDAAGSRVGLGFHPPRNPEPGGEEVMNSYYQEMGAPGASGLRYRIYPRNSLYGGWDEPGKRTMFFTGSQSAIRAGVATGTSAPPGLRD